MKQYIFYKLATKIEQRSTMNKNRVFNSMPEKIGYIKVYMPYGEEGKGFYYSLIKKDDIL